MPRKFRLFALPVLLALLSPCLQDPVRGFEIFPRPEGQYTVQRGDTLYGISGYYYSNPALWPFLWNQNPGVRIKDAGGGVEKQPLQPGSVVNLYAPRRASPLVTEYYHAPTGIPQDVAFLTEKTYAKGIHYDKKFFRYKLTSRPTQIWGYIVCSPDDGKVHYLERDLVYIRFRPAKKQVVLVGDRFGIYRDRGPTNHPLNPERSIGFMSEVVGEIEITSTGHDLATGIVLESYVELQRGDKICLFMPRDREIVPSKTHRMLVGTILRSATRDTWFTINHNLELDVVFIDRGECDGMKEGMLLNIYRPTHPVTDPYTSRRLAIPDRYIGEGLVLKAFDKNSTVLITKTREEVLPGDVIKSVSD
jgi:hypothetical protein